MNIDSKIRVGLSSYSPRNRHFKIFEKDWLEDLDNWPAIEPVMVTILHLLPRNIILVLFIIYRIRFFWEWENFGIINKLMGLFCFVTNFYTPS